MGNRLADELAVGLIYHRRSTPRVCQVIGMNELFDVKSLNGFLWDIYSFFFVVPHPQSP